ncbi:uncharacterized protein DNG_02943 [Cephalotrichum gorgonifer]|uniref:BZIP domain-containing protein n=1 Tax=Cephalotrichum gorgonifer TaxID=2041049 RepID=A0AAE8MU67_9PEZI|nr:uncharacterized protein DNG_02943 [Cephalotrichum gorgonifer]
MSPPSSGQNGESLQKDSANLARIRDNQRRSRARRKEYVQDLEARLRKVEVQGVEAAAEIQLAARRVAEENRRLRALLNRHGVGNAAMEGYLAASSGGDRNRDGGIDGGRGGAAVAAAVTTLESLLVPRRPSGVGLGVPAPSSSRETSVASDSAGRSGWDGGVGGSPGGEPSSLPVVSRQISAPIQSPVGIHHSHSGNYALDGPSSSDHSPYSIEYDNTMPMPYVQLSSPQEYSHIPVDYYSQSRGFSQGQYHG